MLVGNFQLLLYFLQVIHLSRILIIMKHLDIGMMKVGNF